MPTINISQGLYEKLQKKATEHNLNIDETAEQMLLNYTEYDDFEEAGDAVEDAYKPSSSEELAELLQMAEEDEAEEAAGIGIPLEHAIAKIQRELAARRYQQSQKASA